jgi:hypothetical protein
MAPLFVHRNWWLHMDDDVKSKYCTKRGQGGAISGAATSEFVWTWERTVLSHYTMHLYCFSWLDSPSGPRPPHYRGFVITFRHTTRLVGPIWTSDPSVVQTHTWQHITLTTDRHIHFSGGIRTRKPRKRAAADPGLRPRGHWDRHLYCCPDVSIRNATLLINNSINFRFYLLRATFATYVHPIVTETKEVKRLRLQQRRCATVRMCESTDLSFPWIRVVTHSQANRIL